MALHAAVEDASRHQPAHGEEVINLEVRGTEDDQGSMPVLLKAAGASAPSLVELMGSAVASVEATSGGAPGDGGDADGKRGGALATAAGTPPSRKAPGGQVFAKSDPVEEAAKRGAGQAGARDSEAGTAAASGVSLSGLRKAYDGSSRDAGAAGRLGGGKPVATANGGGNADGEVLLVVDDSGDEKSDGGGGANRELEDVWNDVGAQTEEMRQNHQARTGAVKSQDDPSVKPISYREVEQWLRSVVVDPEVFKPLCDLVEVQGCSCLSKSRRGSDVPRLDKKHWKDKDLVLFLKFTDYDFNEMTHWRMLRTMYTKLTRNKACPWVGSHWQQLGFQDTDPRTDLNRSGCVLNVLHMFYGFSHYFEIFKAAYLLAQDHEQNFPLACVSINISSMVIERLLGGQLTGICNGSGSTVTETTCRVHAAGLHYFYKQWRTQRRTIRDTEKTFNEVRELMYSKPKKLLEELARGNDNQKSKTDASRLEYTDMDFGAGLDKQQAAGGSAAPQGKVGAPARAMQYADEGA